MNNLERILSGVEGRHGEHPIRLNPLSAITKRKTEYLGRDVLFPKMMTQEGAGRYRPIQISDMLPTPSHI